MSERPRYASCSVEQHIERPRSAVWEELLAVVDSEFADARKLSVEPPWRLCVDMADQEPDLDFVQVTWVLRDDGPQCHLAIGIVVEPEPTEAGLAARDRLVARLQNAHWDPWQNQRYTSACGTEHQER